MYQIVIYTFNNFQRFPMNEKKKLHNKRIKHT